MRILHVITGLNTGGAETVLYRLIGSSRAFDHEVICLEGRGWYSDKLEALGIKVHHVDWSAVGLPLAVVRLHRLLRTIDTDVVQTWMYRSNLFAGISARLLGKLVVWNIRCSTYDVYPLPTRVLARAGGYLARWVPRRIINCSAASRELHARIGYDSTEGAVIPNGYDPQTFRPDEGRRAATRQALNADPACFLIGTIGRWHPQKGLPQLIAAMGLLNRRGVRVRLQMVGRDLDGSNPELNALIADSGCGELIELMGERSDIPEIARAPDLHVVSSIGGEGFPNAIAETMLSGTPNVTTDVGDAAYIVGNTGWVVPPGDPEQLASAIEEAHSEWATAPDKWRNRRAAARERIAANFTIDRMVQAYEQVWREAGGDKKHQTAADPPVQDGSDRPLRVLHIINSLALGGAEALLYRLITRDSVNEHVVISLGRAGWYSSRLEEQGIPLYHLDMEAPLAVTRGLVELKKIIRRSGADVVQCWMYRSNIVGGVVSKAARKPVVWGIHCSSLEPLRRSSRGLVYLGGVLAQWTPDFIINCSTRSAQLHGKLGYSAANGAVVHNGYDASTYFPNESGRNGARKGLGLGPRTFAIGSIARWHVQKDLPNLLAAVRIVHDHGVPFRCFLVGAGLGPENRALADAIARAGCSEFVVPLGPRSDIPSIARALDVNVLASCGGEAFPNVVAETMLSGTPNVVTDVGDSSLMVGDTGWVVPPRDPQRLADAIIAAHSEWKHNPKHWDRRRKAARDQIADNFSIDRMAHAYEEIWRAVAGRSPLSAEVPIAVAKRRATR